MFFRCIFISFFSALVHFSFVFRVFIRSCISPFIARTSIRMASLFIMISLLIYFLIISEPPGATVEVRSGSSPFSWRSPFPPNSGYIEDLFLSSLQASMKSPVQFQEQAPITKTNHYNLIPISMFAEFPLPGPKFLEIALPFGNPAPCITHLTIAVAAASACHDGRQQSAERRRSYP